MRRLPSLLGWLPRYAAQPAEGQHPLRPPVLGSVGVTLLTAPVSERANPLARLYIIDRLAPGATLAVRPGGPT